MPIALDCCGAHLFFAPGMQSKQFNSSPHISHFAQYSLSCFPAGHSCLEWHFLHVYIVYRLPTHILFMIDRAARM